MGAVRIHGARKIPQIYVNKALTWENYSNKKKPEGWLLLLQSNGNTFFEKMPMRTH